MDEYIDKETLISSIESVDWYSVYRGKLTAGATSSKNALYKANDIYLAIDNVPAADVEPVNHGRWELTTNSFYCDTFDESCELCVYIVANCSECSGNHPNSHQVFSKTLYAPDDADDDFRFDKKAEEEKALLEFRNKKYEFAYYCPNCGAKMDGE